jgi:hypothetical protein
MPVEPQLELDRHGECKCFVMGSGEAAYLEATWIYPPNLFHEVCRSISEAWPLLKSSAQLPSRIAQLRKSFENTIFLRKELSQAFRRNSLGIDVEVRYPSGFQLNRVHTCLH